MYFLSNITSLCTYLVDSEEFTETGEIMYPMWERYYLLRCLFGLVGKALYKQKKTCRVMQKLSAHILYKLKVQKCPEIAAKNNLIVCLLHIVKNSKTIKQHFQFLSWKLISRRFCIEREKLDYTLQITYIILHGLTYIYIICYSKYALVLASEVR